MMFLAFLLGAVTFGAGAYLGYRFGWYSAKGQNPVKTTSFKPGVPKIE